GRHGGQQGGVPIPVSFGTQIAPDALRVTDDEVLVANTGLGTVQVWDRATRDVLTNIAVPRPYDVIRFQGAILVSQPLAGTVSQLDGSTVTPYVSGLNTPAGLAGDDTNLFVASASDGSILQLAENGQVLDAPRVIATGLATPDGIALTKEGDLVTVLDTS